MGLQSSKTKPNVQQPRRSGNNLKKLNQIFLLLLLGRREKKRTLEGKEIKEKEDVF